MILRRGVALLLLAGCGGTATPETTTTTTAPAPIELSSGSALPPGTYTRGGFEPAITFTLSGGEWFAGTLDDGFFDVQHDPGTFEVVAIQFAGVNTVAGAAGAMVPATSAAQAAAALATNPGLVVLGESESQLGGLTGRVVEVENVGDRTAPVMQVAPGTLGIDPGRRLWVALFDTAQGVVAVMVGGPSAGWDQALALAEPILESVVIAAG